MRGTRTYFPDNIILATNVRLSAVPIKGGLDKLEAFLKNLFDQESSLAKAGIQIEHWSVWHADQMSTMLDNAQDVRSAFPGLLTQGTFFPDR